MSPLPYRQLVLVGLVFVTLLLISCRNQIGGEGQALTTIAETRVQREVVFQQLELTHVVSRLAAVHLESGDDFCGRLLWELGGLFIDLAKTYRFLDDLNDEMWISYLDETWADFARHGEMLEDEKEFVQVQILRLDSIISRGEVRCWPS